MPPTKSGDVLINTLAQFHLGLPIGTEIVAPNSPPREPRAVVSGLPGLGAVGAGAASLLIEKSAVKPLILRHIVMDHSLRTLFVNEHGVAEPSSYTLLYAETEGSSIPTLVFIGAFQPPSSTGQHRLADLLLRAAKEMGAMSAFTLGGYHTRSVGRHRKVFVLPNDFQTYRACLDVGIRVTGGQVTGAAGIVAGLAKYHSLKGGCLLAETDGETPDRAASVSLYEKTVDLLECLYPS